MTDRVARQPLLTIRFEHAYWNDADGVLDDEGFDLTIIPTRQTNATLQELGISLRQQPGGAILVASDAITSPTPLTFDLASDRLDVFQVTAFDGEPLRAGAAIGVSVTQDGDTLSTANSLYQPEHQTHTHQVFGRLTLPAGLTLLPGMAVTPSFDALEIQRHFVVIASTPGIDLSTVWLSAADMAPLDATPTAQRVQDCFDGIRLSPARLWPLRQIATDADLMWLHCKTADGEQDHIVAPNPDIDSLDYVDGAVTSVSYIYL